MIFVGLILFLVFIVILGTIAVIEIIKNKRRKKKYIQKIKLGIYYLDILGNYSNFIVLPDDYFMNIQDCLYKISNLNAMDIIKDDVLRSFMSDYKRLDYYKSKTWQKYIIIL